MTKASQTRTQRIESIEVGPRRRPVSQEKVTELARSISELGLLQPIGITEDRQLVYGTHRLEACRLLGWTEIQATVLPDCDELTRELAEIDENLIRNELRVLLRAQHIKRRNEILEEMGLRAQSGDNQFSEGGETVSPPTVSPLKTTTDLAAEVGVGERTLQKYQQIANGITPKNQARLIDHPVADSTTQLVRIAQMKPEQQNAIVDQLVDNDIETVTEAARRVNQDRVSEMEFPEGKHRVIYADPPWSYGNSGTGKDDAGYSSAKQHYPTMSISELCEMDVKSIAGDNAVLFIWATSPLLEDSFRVINAWGFKYKTTFVWDKVKHNFGHYNSVRHEFLLVCTRGSCTPDNSKLFDSVVEIERSKKHSEKPEEFRKMIETLYTNGERVELFARSKAEGWNVYGNQVN